MIRSHPTSVPSSLAGAIVDPRRKTLMELGEEVSVLVQCHRDRAVATEFLDLLWVRAGFNGERYGRVPEVADSEAWFEPTTIPGTPAECLTRRDPDLVVNRQDASPSTWGVGPPRVSFHSFSPYIALPLEQPSRMLVRRRA